MKCPDTNCTVRADLPTPPEPNTTTLNSFMTDLLEWRQWESCFISSISIRSRWRSSPSLWGDWCRCQCFSPTDQLRWAGPLCCCLFTVQSFIMKNSVLISHTSLSRPQASRLTMPEIKQFLIRINSWYKKHSVMDKLWWWSVTLVSSGVFTSQYSNIYSSLRLFVHPIKLHLERR